MRVKIKSAALKDNEAIEAMKNYEKFKKPRNMSFSFYAASDSSKSNPIKCIGKSILKIGNSVMMLESSESSFFVAIPLDASIQFNESNEQIYVKSKLGTYLIEW